MSFTQDNEDASNTLDIHFCEQRRLFILADTEPGSLLTDNQDVELKIDVNLAPTHLTVEWTTPFTLTLTTDLAIAEVHADLTFVDATVPRDLTAEVDILSIPSHMEWDIDPSGSIAFTATGSIGTVSIEVSDPNGLPGAETFFSGVPLRLLDGLAHNVPSFAATWSSASAPGYTSAAFNTVAASPLWDMAFAISTSETSFATVGGVEQNRVMFYSDNSQNLGTGFVLETSLWLRVQDISRAEFSSGGAVPTFAVGYDTASMDLTVVPSESFDYQASAGISHIDIDAWIGDLSPGAPTPADVDRVQADVFNLPATASGQWDATGDAGFFHLQTSSGLGRAEVVIDNAFGVFGSDFVHMEAFIDDLPENANADWDVGARTGTIAFTNSLFTGGLGEAFVLATTMNQVDTTNYINSLNIDPSVCMTTYTEYEHQIDARFWPGTVLDGDLKDLYCRNPELDTSADDYVVYRVGGGDKVFTGRIRSLNEVGVDLGNSVGSANVDFSATASRQLYIRSEDTGADKLTLVELSELPNHIHADYSLPGGAAGTFHFSDSQVIDFIDVYTGTRSPTSQTQGWKKFLVKDLPSSASLVFNFGSVNGVADFTISNTFEVGFAIQEANKRYAGWVQVTGLHFDYHLHGPGSHSTSYDIGYFIAHVHVDLHTVPSNTAINGILGIYNLKAGPAPLTTSPPTTPANAYIPEWSFMLINFKQFLLDILWDIGVSFFSDGDILKIGLFPSVTLVADFSIVVDYWWNSGFTIDLPFLLLPIPPTPSPCLGAPLPWFLDGSIHLNPVPDYTENHQIHLLPWTHAFELEFDMSGSVGFDCFDPPSWQVDVNLDVNIAGFHGPGDHGDPSPV
ncbi:MAG: hypothetical protein E6K10_02215 [Methanobacteriota archaeon]|nr:MAG: hypothetical protein E6K10_02215 [Euryarchaeota archaeon]